MQEENPPGSTASSSQPAVPWEPPDLGMPLFQHGCCTFESSQGKVEGTQGRSGLTLPWHMAMCPFHMRACPSWLQGWHHQVTTVTLSPSTHRSSVHKPVGSLLAVQGIPVLLLPLLPCPAKPKTGEFMNFTLLKPVG